ncbi:hypothetical protein IIE26_09205 [Cytobacillus oceanisediminis]|uniref:hypothetical protein n=1 Tax=Cytobacillus oceanisediminis TaxID=665099 RepID=UPI0018651A22|nr:hypothetical protein [Cytobacillus oceanisediminis]QOK28819.1 hypothetical protein IIE26_09205 [Cytobacillus oceanisediminis]
MENVNIKPLYEGHDKAYAHALGISENLSSVPAFRQARLANYDGSDDPTIIKKIHYIQNEYNGKSTRFISGFETRLSRPSRKMINTQGKFTCPIMQELI